MGKIPQREIYRLLADMKGSVGLYINLLDTDEVFEINPELVYPSASVIKIPMLALLLKDVHEGRGRGLPANGGDSGQVDDCPQ